MDVTDESIEVISSSTTQDDDCSGFIDLEMDICEIIECNASADQDEGVITIDEDVQREQNLALERVHMIRMEHQAIIEQNLRGQEAAGFDYSSEIFSSSEEDEAPVPTLVSTLEQILTSLCGPGATCVYLSAAWACLFPYNSGLKYFDRFMSPDFLCMRHSVWDVFPYGRVPQFNSSNVYEFVGALGQGAFGYVYRVREIRTNQHYACKVLVHNRSEYSVSMVENEIRIQSALIHHNLLTLYHNFSVGNMVYMICELGHDKTLKDLIIARKQLTIKEMQFFMKGLINGIYYMHSRGVIHRDLKPANLLLDSNNFQIKIADFGLAINSGPYDIHRKLCGTANYMAPEMVHFVGYGFEVDIWAAGCVFYNFFEGSPPFGNAPKEMVYKRIREAKYTIPNIINQNAKQMMAAMLEYQKENRESAKDLLKMDFINSSDIVDHLDRSIFDNDQPREKLKQRSLLWF